MTRENAWARRVWKKVKKSGPDECWLWQGAKNENGYGDIRLGPFHVRPHRLVWEMTYGRIHDGRLVLHSCDTPLCVNPAHLRLGTHQENADDKVARGRCRSGDGGWLTRRKQRPRVAGMPAKRKREEPVLTQLIDGQECVGISEAARIKGVSRQAIWVRVQRGTIPHIYVAGRIYIPLAALRDA